MRHAKGLRLKEANRVLEEAAQSADCRFTFKGGAALWDSDSLALTVTDAIWAGEDDVSEGKVEPFRSQKARFNGLAGPGFIDGNSDSVHPLCAS
eukprot:5909862-Pyramimonas_sp.AAC.1